MRKKFEIADTAVQQGWCFRADGAWWRTTKKQEVTARAYWPLAGDWRSPAAEYSVPAVPREIWDWQGAHNSHDDNGCDTAVIVVVAGRRSIFPTLSRVVKYNDREWCAEVVGFAANPYAVWKSSRAIPGYSAGQQWLRIIA